MVEELARGSEDSRDVRMTLEAILINECKDLLQFFGRCKCRRERHIP